MSVRSLVQRVSGALFGRAGNSLEQRNLRNIIWSGAFVGFIDGGILVYLPVFLARLGASPTTMGLLSSGPSLLNMLLYMPGGAFAERQRDLVRLVNWSVGLLRCGYLAIAALPFFLADDQIPLAAVIIWSLINGGTAFFWPALLVVIQRAVSPAQRPRAMGGRWASMTVVATILIPILGLVIDHTTFPTGYQLAFIVSFAGAIPNLYFWSRVHVAPNVRQDSDSSVRRPLSERLHDFLVPFIKNKMFMRYNVGTALFRICLSLPAGLYSLFWVNDLRASNTLIGVRGMAGFGALAAAYWLWGRLAYRMGHRRLLVLTGALMGLYPIATGLAQSAQWLVPAAVIWGMSAAGIDIALVDILLVTSPEARKTSFVAIGNMLASAESFAGPLLGAALASLIGIQEALLVSGVLIVASVGFFVLLPTREQEYALHTEQTHTAG